MTTIQPPISLAAMKAATNYELEIRYLERLVPIDRQQGKKSCAQQMAELIEELKKIEPADPRRSSRPAPWVSPDRARDSRFRERPGKRGKR